MNSHNHPMFGSVGANLYRSFAGIQQAPDSAGFRQLRIAPQSARDLRWASGSIETVRGTVSSRWSRGDGMFQLEVVVPVGSEAEVTLPKLNLHSAVVKEGGQPVWQGGAFLKGQPGINGGSETAGAVVLQIGSGRYSFELTGQ
jgi:alpha-L-rhamnosidase